MDTTLKINNKNAVIYTRYSSDSQTEQSIEGKIRVINEYAKHNNIPIIETYIELYQKEEKINHNLKEWLKILKIRILDMYWCINMIDFIVID